MEKDALEKKIQRINQDIDATCSWCDEQSWCRDQGKFRAQGLQASARSSEPLTKQYTLAYDTKKKDQYADEQRLVILRPPALSIMHDVPYSVPSQELPDTKTLEQEVQRHAQFIESQPGPYLTLDSYSLAQAWGFGLQQSREMEQSQEQKRQWLREHYEHRLRVSIKWYANEREKLKSAPRLTNDEKTIRLKRIKDQEVTAWKNMECRYFSDLKWTAQQTRLQHGLIDDPEWIPAWRYNTMSDQPQSSHNDLSEERNVKHKHNATQEWIPDSKEFSGSSPVQQGRCLPLATKPSLSPPIIGSDLGENQPGINQNSALKRSRVGRTKGKRSNNVLVRVRKIEEIESRSRLRHRPLSGSVRGTAQLDD